MLKVATRLTGLKSLKVDLQGPVSTEHVDDLADLPLEKLWCMSLDTSSAFRYWGVHMCTSWAAAGEARVSDCHASGREG